MAKNQNDYYAITKYDPYSPISEEYRKVRASINFINLDKDLKTINLTSVFQGEGKTLTAINLATVYAHEGKKTLLIDLDLRRPKAHQSFNMSNQNGVCEFVQKKTPINDYIVNIDKNLDFINAGDKVPFPSEVLSSKIIKNMINDLSKDYDKIIIDSPPVAPVADSLIISNLCEATVFVIKSRHTDIDIAKDCLKKLKHSGANVIGSVLTNVQKDDYLYKKQYYSYYGH